MKIGIVHSRESTTCHCAKSIAKGLDDLGYEYLVVEAEDLASHLDELSNCEVVFDHTDIYLGGYERRFEVRKALEEAGCRVVGSTSKVIKLCDDKAATKNCLMNAGLPVPAGFVVDFNTEGLPEGKLGPYIVKAALDHMSRNLFVLDNLDLALNKAKELNKKLDQNILIEELIEGEEVRISIIPDETGHPLVLPVMKTLIGGPEAVMTNESKVGKKIEKEVFQGLDSVTNRCQEVGLQAFEALGVLDYVRFDARLDQSGEPILLEANCIPSMRPASSFALSAKEVGIDYPHLLDRLIQNTLKRYEDS